MANTMNEQEHANMSHINDLWKRIQSTTIQKQQESPRKKQNNHQTPIGIAQEEVTREINI